jgi:uncharacterized protein YjiK
MVPHLICLVNKIVSIFDVDIHICGMRAFFYWLFFLTNICFLNSHADCQSGKTLRRIEYDLSAPDKIYKLPPALYEISGMTETDASTIACIQDEHGIFFFYDINKNQIVRQIVFGSEGDYEDIVRVDKTLYVMRSDELLIEIKDFNSDNFKSAAYSTGIPGRNTEGLCYDLKNNRLLIVPKEIPDDNPENKGKRFIYGFDLGSKKLIKGAVLKLDIKVIEKFALENNIKVPVKSKKGEKKEPDIKLKISAIGIHPISGRLYVLSGPERLLLVFDMNGNIEYLERLDKDLFPQPEGITFMKNGDMFISNEGRNTEATLIRFNYNLSLLPVTEPL